MANLDDLDETVYAYNAVQIIEPGMFSDTSTGPGAAEMAYRTLFAKGKENTVVMHFAEGMKELFVENEMTDEGVEKLFKRVRASNY